jgi:hypothetical protein
MASGSHASTPDLSDRFAPLLDAVRRVCSDFDSTNEFLPIEHGRWRRIVGWRWEYPIRDMCFVLDPTEETLAAHVTLSLVAPPERRYSLVEAVARANYGLLSAAFEIDVDSGEVRCRSSLPLDLGDIEAPRIAALIAEILQLVAVYAPALDAVSDGAKDPNVAVAEVETSG